LGAGSPAPHQAASLRHVTEERSAEQEHLSQAWHGAHQHDVGLGNGQQQHHNERATHHQNGDMSGMAEDGELADAESDDNLDDDGSDKISSSPSINDGGYKSSSIWPRRTSSLPPISTSLRESLGSSLQSSPVTDSASSSPFVSTPPYFPIVIQQAEVRTVSPTPRSEKSSLLPSPLSSSLSPISSKSTVQILQSDHHHHHEGEYLRAANRLDLDYNTSSDHVDHVEEDTVSSFDTANGVSKSLDDSDEVRMVQLQLQECCPADPEDLMNILPSNDEVVDDGFFEGENEALEYPDYYVPSDVDSDSWETDSNDAASWDENEPGDDDDDNDFLFPHDSRFVDSGWGGECLRESEDIDFEFVYALHTFVATVEGQANATKGDTMVLLDDSNSYWWLVRIVKDGSIGTRTCLEKCLK
jgi:hypothetical protein